MTLIQVYDLHRSVFTYVNPSFIAQIRPIGNKQYEIDLEGDSSFPVIVDEKNLQKLIQYGYIEIVN